MISDQIDAYELDHLPGPCQASITVCLGARGCDSVLALGKRVDQCAHTGEDADSHVDFLFEVLKLFLEGRVIGDSNVILPKLVIAESQGEIRVGFNG